MISEIKSFFTTAATVTVVCGLVAGAFMAGAASQTHITVIVERPPQMSTVAEEAEKVALNSLAPKPARKPSH